MSHDRFEIQIAPYRRYLFVTGILTGLLFFGVGLLVFAVLWKLGLRDATDRMLSSIEYRIRDGALCVEQEFAWGVLQWRSKKSIPLERITDLRLVQGPMLSYFGIWRMEVQTAGAGAMRSEACLMALAEPDSVRRQIMDLIGERRAA